MGRIFVGEQINNVVVFFREALDKYGGHAFGCEYIHVRDETDWKFKYLQADGSYKHLTPEEMRALCDCGWFKILKIIKDSTLESEDAYREALKDMVKLVGEVEEGLADSERERWSKAAALVGVELE